MRRRGKRKRGWRNGESIASPTNLHANNEPVLIIPRVSGRKIVTAVKEGERTQGRRPRYREKEKPEVYSRCARAEGEITEEGKRKENKERKRDEE